MTTKNTVDLPGVWIFQAVPADWDILVEVPRVLKTPRQTERWWVGQHGDDMVIGDRVLLWRSGINAGIYGTGILTSVAYRRGGDRWVDVQFDPLLKKPLYKETLLHHPRLRNLNIIRMGGRGTNFSITSGEWKELRRFLDVPESVLERERRDAEDRFPDFDPKSQRDARNKILAEIVMRQGQPKFRRQLLRIFGGKCLISGCDAEPALEAAHIIPYKGKLTNTPRNGLILRSDLHTLFDLYLIAIDVAKKRLRLAPSLKGTLYSTLEKQALKLPKGGPSPNALKHHLAEFRRRLRQTQ